MNIHWSAVLALVLVAGCGGTPATAGPSSQTGHKARPPSDPNAVELTLRTEAGPLIFVGDMRGRPVLLFMFATFDGMSQAALTPLERFVAAHPEVQVVGVAIQPDAERLIGPYVHALSPPFPIGYDPENALEKGDTPIGKVDLIPSFVMLDALGRPVVRHVGLATVEQLERMLEMAREAVSPERAQEELAPLPLMGDPVH
jgi:hypothetical protein